MHLKLPRGRAFIHWEASEQAGGFEVFNPQFIVSSIISRTSLLGRDTPPLKLELRSENNPGFDCLAISGTEIYGQLSDSIWETLETDLGMARWQSYQGVDWIFILNCNIRSQNKT